ncbi:MAG: JDVT-CTERM domain-containing protein [Nevskiales bacterium]
MTDEVLTRQSPVVVLGQVTQITPSESLNRAVTHYQLNVVEVLKGEVPASTLTVQTLGATRPTANSHWLPGMPVFTEDEALLLFLRPLDNGNYGIMHLGLGAFKLQRNALGEQVFVRDLDEARRLQVAAPLANALNEIQRPAADFLASFGSQYRHIDTSQMTPDESSRQTANYTLLRTNPIDPPSRWFEFDAGQSVTFFMHVDGQPGMSDGGEAAIRRALSAWTSDTGSNIRYLFGGETVASVGFTANDLINAILFDDPNDEVDGTFSCQEGGVLAAGGFVSTSATSEYQGIDFADIIEADIITNDGAACYYGVVGDESFAEEIFGHELGHTLGIGHSCGGSALLVFDECDTATAAERDALMRAFPHQDGRGADLRADDRAAVAFLYEQSGSSTAPPSNGGGTVVVSDDPGVSPNATPSGGGGGGGCSLQAGGPLDPMLWLLSLGSMFWIMRRKRRA